MRGRLIANGNRRAGKCTMPVREHVGHVGTRFDPHCSITLKLQGLPVVAVPACKRKPYTAVRITEIAFDGQRFTAPELPKKKAATAPQAPEATGNEEQAAAPVAKAAAPKKSAAKKTPPKKAAKKKAPAKKSSASTG